MLYIVPTRGRPHKAVELMEEWRRVTAFADLLFVIDSDDPYLTQYASEIVSRGFKYFLIEPMGSGMVAPLNFAAVSDARFHDTVGFMGDDHRPRTDRWDEKLRDAIRGKLFAYGDDLVQRRVLPTAILMSSRVVSALGFMAPPQLKHLYVDNYWRELGRQTNSLVYVPEVIIEHVHPITGKTEWDDEYRRVNDGAMYAHDANAYAALLETQLPRDVETIRSLM